MSRFRYLRDPVFVVACGLYAGNRWLLVPWLHLRALRAWGDNLLLIPCALPPLLLAQRWARLRDHDQPPTAGEVLAHLAAWAVLFEVLGPRLTAHATGDPGDVVAYAVGAAAALAAWHAG